MNDLVKSYIEKIDAEATLDIVCSHVANGGTVEEYCQNLNVNYSTMLKFLNSPGAKELFDQAKNDRKEWLKERAVREYQAIAFIDMKDFYDDNGNAREMSELPSDLTRSIQSVKKTVKDDEESTEIKFHDKTKALDAIIKYGAEYVPQANVNLKADSSLEALIGASFKKEEESE